MACYYLHGKCSGKTLRRRKGAPSGDNLCNFRFVLALKLVLAAKSIFNGCCNGVVDNRVVNMIPKNCFRRISLTHLAVVQDAREALAKNP